ncbi:MAG TPA: hypothetical protein VFA87_07110 [Rhizomicrobium sp.]|nr:hypothetical protein [Rhizomicrobium sp.]
MGRAKLMAMRAFFLCLLLSPLMLGGCNAITRQDGDYFEAAGVPPAQFDNDDQNCRMQAADYVGYDVHGMGGTRYDRNRAFNATYARCMRGRGYRPRPYYKNWLPS